MLELRHIKKDYYVDNKPVPAIKDISLAFQDAGFVSILGPSGCGKTTLLNLIGGLDHYTDGDLLIDGKSTKEFTDSEWDSYRNERVGFVFQTYNLIPHMTLLANVEIPLLLNGVSKAERKERALEALRSVGLGEEANKKPNQLSGGQMQRVALARAMINHPTIVLADEPTGALDSVTSVQMMDLLKEIAKDHLVVMVTHNRELAEQYSDRIIEMKDGIITSDSAPIDVGTAVEGKEITKKTSMNFLTALKSSWSNIRTKRGRTIMTSIASSIGLIGVALVLSVSNGFSIYVSNVERSVASAVPISIMPVSYSYSANYEEPTEEYPDTDFVSVRDSSASIISVHQNVFTQEYFDYLNALLEDPVKSEWVNSILFNREGQDFHLLTKIGNNILAVNQYRSAGGASGSVIGSVTGLPAYIFHELYTKDEDMSSWYDVIAGKLPTAKDEIVLLVDRYNQVESSTLNALGFFDFDDTLKPKEISFNDILAKTYKVYRNVDWFGHDEYKTITKSVYAVDQFNQDTFQLEGHESTQDIHYFQRTHHFGEVYSRDDIYHPLELKVVGILRPSPASYINLMPSSLGYTTALKEWITADGTDDPDPEVAAKNAALDARIKEAASTNVYLSKPDEFDSSDSLEELNDYFAESNAKRKGDVHTLQEIFAAIKNGDISELVEEDTAKLTTFMTNLSGVLSSSLGYSAYWAESDATTPAVINMSTFLKNAQKVGADLKETKVSLTASADSFLGIFVKYGGIDGFCTNGMKSIFNTLNNLSRINANAIDYLALMNQFAIITSILIFPSSLTCKENLTDYLDAYNHYNNDLSYKEKPFDEQIIYSDIMGSFTSSLSVLIDVISIVLIVFASISLVVSSIMTGIITYVSVVERTKEIGILRACGARKKDVGRLFEAECVIIGTVAGLIGIGVTVGLDIPISLIIDHEFPGNNLASIAQLNPLHAIALIVIAIILAFIAGLIPSRIAAKKDPVVALRTE